MKKLVAIALLLLLGCPAFGQQTPKGFAPCGNGLSLSVTNSSGNVQLNNCGPSVVLMNVGTQEAFFNVGQLSSTAANSNGNVGYSIPGGAYLMITVPDQTAAGWYVASVTATSTTTLKIIEGRAS